MYTWFGGWLMYMNGNGKGEGRRWQRLRIMVLYIYGEAWNPKEEKTTNKHAKASKHKKVKKYLRKKLQKKG